MCGRGVYERTREGTTTEKSSRGVELGRVVAVIEWVSERERERRDRQSDQIYRRQPNRKGRSILKTDLYSPPTPSPPTSSDCRVYYKPVVSSGHPPLRAPPRPPPAYLPPPVPPADRFSDTRHDGSFFRPREPERARTHARQSAHTRDTLDDATAAEKRSSCSLANAVASHRYIIAHDETPITDIGRRKNRSAADYKVSRWAYDVCYSITLGYLAAVEPRPIMRFVIDDPFTLLRCAFGRRKNNAFSIGFLPATCSRYRVIFSCIYF